MRGIQISPSGAGAEGAQDCVERVGLSGRDGRWQCLHQLFAEQCGRARIDVASTIGHAVRSATKLSGPRGLFAR
jgi:hypothetical protein